MLNLVENFMNSKIEDLKKAKDADIVTIKETDKDYKALRSAVYDLRNRREVADLSGYKFSDEIKAKIAERKAKFNADVNAVYSLVDEINAMVNLADKPEEVKSILKTYGIL